MSNKDTNQASEDKLDEILFEAIEAAATYTHNVTAEEADYIQNKAKQAILAWRDREVASRAIEELEQIKRLSNGKFGKQIVVTGDGQIALQQLLKIYGYSVDRIAKLKSEVESL